MARLECPEQSRLWIHVTVISVLLFICLAIPLARGQQSTLVQPSFTDRIALTTDSAGPMRFVAVHGRRSVIMGYPQAGLEVWGYPFQILSDYQVGFKPVDGAAEADGRLLLRRIDYRPDSVTRTYIGPDYLVREKLFVPLDEAAAVIGYEVEGSRALDIEIHFTPVLNLMWPGALGGQYTRWTQNVTGDVTGEMPAYVITEPSTGISAAVGSPEIVAHDDTVNSTVRVNGKVSFTLRPRANVGRPPTATVLIALNAANTKAPLATLSELSKHLPGKQAEAAAHYRELEGKSLQIHTPDEEVNRALAWSEVALDQAWVCNAKVGCGIVAGYGPSRDARRPQYDWFFAGDGLLATNALISAGEYSRAREELTFIAKYQEPTTGMIWHELSQSVGYVDWSKYPYMYVHVDISFDYLSTVARYVAVSGDTAFATERWPSIAAVYRYCRSLIRDSDHLPHIPADKEGGDEQSRPGDDLTLSASWITAAAGFAQLSQLTGHTHMADEALKEAQLTRQAIATRYWNSEENFWIAGHTQAGTAIPSRRQGPTQLLVQNVFLPRQNQTLLDQLASSDFLSDWGLRELALTAPDYDPYSYGRGSVSAPGTTGAAITFWQAHRPEIAFEIWSAVLPWSTLDSPGHIHEVLAGNFYHEQTESVPEQTWSSAGLLDASVRGLLGLDIQGAENRIRLSPHLPAEWNRISVENVRLPHSTLALTIRQSMSDVDLEIANEGSATHILFNPRIPLGANILGAEYQGRPVDVSTESFSEDEHARLTLDVPPGRSHCHLRFDGGISLILKRPILHVGDPSTALKLTGLQLQGQTLSIEADVYSFAHPAGNAAFQIRTPWKITAHEGAAVLDLADNKYQIEVDRAPAPGSPGSYRHTRLKLTFERK